jgi:aspartyl-tRNA(Asn)/glutamyl-tRNA(Gln) amidotransferase subunit A
MAQQWTIHGDRDASLDLQTGPLHWRRDGREPAVSELRLDRLTIEDFGRLWRAGSLSAVELTDYCLQRIADDNKRLNAFTLVTAEQARIEARNADRERAAGIDRGPLHGVPISLKDLIDLRGTPTTAASRVREGHLAREDAATVVRLRRAGAVFVGKTNLHEFAFGTTTEETAFGTAHNPYDVTRSPGGSSGGSAISVAAGMALASIGTDTGGSIRIPSAACGLTGLKPALHEVPTGGVVPLSHSLDHVGPLARSVGDSWLVHAVLAMEHVDAAQQRVPGAKPASLLRVAVLRPYFCDLLDEEVRERFEQALDRLRGAGVFVGEAGVAHAAEIAPVYSTIVHAEAAAYHAATLDEMPERYSPPVRLRLEVGRYLLAEDYVRAQNGRGVLLAEVEDALAGYDALVLPTLPIPAPAHGQQLATFGTKTEPVRSLMLRSTQLFNLTGHPAISIPCGTTTEGLPCGLQLVGKRRQTRALVAAALSCESVLADRPSYLGPSETTQGS